MTDVFDLRIAMLIRSVLVRDGHTFVSVVRSSKGWQANLKNLDGSYHVAIADDPLAALDHCLSPIQFQWVKKAQDDMNQRRSIDDPIKRNTDLFGPLTKSER